MKKLSYRDLQRHIKAQDGVIKTLSKQLAEERAEKLKYWGLYQDQLEKTKDLSVAGNQSVCNFYLDCELANPMCLTGNDLNLNCTHKAFLKAKMIEVVNG